MRFSDPPTSEDVLKMANAIRVCFCKDLVIDPGFTRIKDMPYELYQCARFAVAAVTQYPPNWAMRFVDPDDGIPMVEKPGHWKWIPEEK